VSIESFDVVIVEPGAIRFDGVRSLRADNVVCFFDAIVAVAPTAKPSGPRRSGVSGYEPASGVAPIFWHASEPAEHAGLRTLAFKHIPAVPTIVPTTFAMQNPCAFHLIFTTRST
jgi:hypothetical protein